MLILTIDVYNDLTMKKFSKIENHTEVFFVSLIFLQDISSLCPVN